MSLLHVSRLVLPIASLLVGIAFPAHGANVIQGAVRQVALRNARSIVTVQGVLPMSSWEFRANRVLGGGGKATSADSAAAAQPLAVGIVVDKTGLILAAGSKLPGCLSYSVRTAEGKTVPARWVGFDDSRDIASLRAVGAGPPGVSAPELSAPSGEWAAILSRNSSNQISTSLGMTLRSANSRGDVGITSAAAPLGGVLVDGEGRWIAVVAAGQPAYDRFAETTYDGSPVLAHAWSRDQLMRAASDVQRSSITDRGYLGVRLDPPRLDSATGTPVPEGAHVAEVLAGSPAAVGGVRAGDRITRFNQRAVDGPDALGDRVARTPPGTQIYLTVERGKASLEKAVRIATVPPVTSADTLSVHEVFDSQVRWFKEQFASLRQRVLRR